MISILSTYCIQLRPDVNGHANGHQRRRNGRGRGDAGVGRSGMGEPVVSQRYWQYPTQSVRRRLSGRRQSIGVHLLGGDDYEMWSSASTSIDSFDEIVAKVRRIDNWELRDIIDIAMDSDTTASLSGEEDEELRKDPSFLL